MAHAVGGGGGTQPTPTYKVKGEKLDRALVVEEVRVVEVEKRIEVPNVVYKDVEQVRYKTREEEQTKLITKEAETIKFVPKEVETVHYNAREEETVKYIPKEVKVEKPILVDTPYERPVINNKEYTLVTYKELPAIRELLESIPKLLGLVSELSAKLAEVKNFKLVEEVKKVPKIEYIPTPVERIVWVDVERERPSLANQG